MTEPAPFRATGEAAAAQPHDHAHSVNMRKLALGALGVVYGDIGTSPLYAVHECFNGEHHASPTPADVFGILSLIFWSLTLVVVVKYISFIMRADNRGEGGILALLALVAPKGSGVSTAGKTALIMLGLFGAALLYGDGVITPAISVLSAIEGLDVATTAFHKFIIPLTLAILIGLFMVQRRGTAGIGAVFGPTMLVWFTAIGALGLPGIVRAPGVLTAVNPIWAVRFMVHHGVHGFLVLGSVVLCITGGEALYADMGHFGKRPIRIAWYVMVFPALLLNYFGQGALLLSACAESPNSAVCRRVLDNPFYELVPHALLIPMVGLAGIATVVASQALISGAFSLTQQAVQLGYCPRVSIVHTSGEAEGQIYVPEVNTALMVACCALVLGFQQSSRLAAAYGIAVTGTMAITSLLFYAVARQLWKWSVLKAGAIVALFLTLDLSFFAANVVKIASGGWFPIAVASLVFVMMTTWKRGRAALAMRVLTTTMPMPMFLEDMERVKPYRVKGTAVFMAQNTDGVPAALLHHFKHNKVLHEQVVLLAIRTDNVPEVPPEERVEVKNLGQGFWGVSARYGFMQNPRVPEIMKAVAEKGCRTVADDTSYYLGRETLLTTGRSGMARWRKALFVLMSRNARPATSFFQLPPNRVVEMGMQIEL